MPRDAALRAQAMLVEYLMALVEQKRLDVAIALLKRFRRVLLQCGQAPCPSRAPKAAHGNRSWWDVRRSILLLSFNRTLFGGFARAGSSEWL